MVFYKTYIEEYIFKHAGVSALSQILPVDGSQVMAGSWRGWSWPSPLCSFALHHRPRCRCLDFFFVIFCRLVNPNSNPCPDSLSIEHAAATQQCTENTQNTVHKGLPSKLFSESKFKQQGQCLNWYSQRQHSIWWGHSLICIHRENTALGSDIH